jgi:hypothetical protein
MLSAEAMRLAAIEVLCPTESKSSDLGWPTLARHRVYDSAEILPEDLNQQAKYTPCLSLYTDEIRMERRGDTSPSSDSFPVAVLVVIAELAVAAEGDGGEPTIMPLVENDAQARLVLGALCAQVRQSLNLSEAGGLFRWIVSSVEDLRIEPYSLPQFDIRWMRSTMRFTCKIREDTFREEGGMPEPMRSLFSRLPEASYAKAKLAELDAIFAAPNRKPLELIGITSRGAPGDPPDASVKTNQP